MGTGAGRIRGPAAALFLGAALLLPLPAAATGTLKIGTDGTCDVFRMRDSVGKGVDIDVIQALCARIGARCERVSLSREDLIPALEEGRVDAAVLPASLATGHPARLAVSTPYYCGSVRLVAPRGEVPVPDRDGLRNKRIGVVRGSAAARWLEDTLGSAAAPTVYDTLEEALGDLAGVRLDAVLSISCPLYEWILSPAGAQFELKSEPVTTSDEFVIASRGKNREALNRQFDAALSAVIACCRSVRAPAGSALPGPRNTGKPGKPDIR